MNSCLLFKLEYWFSFHLDCISIFKNSRVWADYSWATIKRNAISENTFSPLYEFLPKLFSLFWSNLEANYRRKCYNDCIYIDFIRHLLWCCKAVYENWTDFHFTFLMFTNTCTYKVFACKIVHGCMHEAWKKFYNIVLCMP